MYIFFLFKIERELYHLTYMLQVKESCPNSFLNTSCLSLYKYSRMMSMVEVVNLLMLHFYQSQHMEAKQIEATEKT